MKHALILMAGCAMAVSAWAKLPALSDEAKAKAAEAAAKAAHGAKVEAYALCKSMDKTAAHYYKTAKAAHQDTRPPLATPPCVDPGAFVYAPAPAPAAPAAPAKKS